VDTEVWPEKLGNSQSFPSGHPDWESLFEILSCDSRTSFNHIILPFIGFW